MQEFPAIRQHNIHVLFKKIKLIPQVSPVITIHIGYKYPILAHCDTNYYVALAFH